MDIIDFLETYLNIKLLDYQKKLLRLDYQLRRVYLNKNQYNIDVLLSHPAWKEYELQYQDWEE